jgi:tetratricopeptide (TPR) repeat protein
MIPARLHWPACLAGALLLGGCATLPLGGGDDAAPRGEVVRPHAPPEYDVLVAQQLTLEGHSAEAVEAYLRAVAKDPGSAYLHRRAATSLAQHNRLAEALQHAERAVELDPEDATSRIFVAQLYRLRRQPELAERVLVDASGEPIDPDAAFLIYQMRMDADRFEEALAMARWMVEHDPDDLRGQLAVANVYQRMDRSADAERALREALRKDPGNLRVYGALARILRQREDHAAEKRLYDEILALYPYHHGTLVALGEAQLAAEDVPGALRTFELVEERYPDDLRTAVRLGYLYFEERRHEEAAEQFERVLEANPGDTEVAFFLAVVRRRLGDTEGSVELFSGIPQDDDYYSEARVQIASIFERRGDYAKAIEQVELALAARPDREFQLYAATLLSKSGDLDGAVQAIETLLDDDPADDELLFNLGVVYGEAERIDQALIYMQRALEENPDNASALNYIGYTWAEKGQNLDEAERMIERAIALRPDDGYIVDSLGWVYYMRALPLVESGRRAEARPLIHRALRELTRAEELTGGDPVISEHLGDTYLLLDEKHRALEKFEEAIRLEPREGEQPRLLEKFESLRRELR